MRVLFDLILRTDDVERFADLLERKALAEDTTLQTIFQDISFGRTLLHDAAMYECVKCANYILSKCDSPITLCTMLDTSYCTPFYLAIANCGDIVDMMLSIRHADILCIVQLHDGYTEYGSALHHMILNDRSIASIARVLKLHPASVKMMDSNGMTPIKLVECSQSPELERTKSIVKLLG